MPGRRMRVAWLVLVGLWLGVLALHTYKQHQTQQELDKTLDGLRTRALEVSQLRDRLASTEAQARHLTELKASTPSPLLLLNALTQELDDQTWLQGLELRGEQVTLRGISSAPATLIETLEGTTLLKEVRFDAAITRDGRGQGDRFNISAKLEPPAEEGGS